MPGLGTSFGRGGATTFQQDLQNSDCIVIQGSNMAECHPVGFQWVMEAKQRGATIIHVDPRFTRTSAMADIHVPIRPGSDIAFLGGIINYIIENRQYFEDYVVHYTNAPCIISKDFKDTDELDGLFSGWNPEKRRYDSASWQYDGVEVSAAAGEREMFAGDTESKQRGGDVMSEKVDNTLQDPQCVFQILRGHFARYTPEIRRLCNREIAHDEPIQLTQTFSMQRAIHGPYNRILAHDEIAAHTAIGHSRDGPHMRMVATDVREVIKAPIVVVRGGISEVRLHQ